VALVKENGFDVRVIDRSEFDHGATRQLGVDSFDNIDVCVFITQDAFFSNDHSLHRILEPFHDDRVAAVCGRQLPSKQAVPIEAHARLYNYGSRSFVRSIGDVKRFGLKTAFISNSFAAYRVSALKEVGGFPENVIFGEDMLVAAKLLKSGYKIAYAADACVYHSHKYSVFQEFNRYFDMGVFHAKEPWLRQEFGTAENEGLKFVGSEMQYLLRHAFWMIPAGILRTIMKYVGFRMGLAERHMPLNIKRKISMNPGYFKNAGDHG
jgi:rhamnosyltransferase